MPTKRFSLRYVFFVMTSVAVGACLFGQPRFHPTIRAVGLSIVLYWIAKAFFVTSTRLPKVAREVVFLMGLPFYVSSALTCIGGILWFLGTLFDR